MRADLASAEDRALKADAPLEQPSVQLKEVQDELKKVNADLDEARKQTESLTSALQASQAKLQQEAKLRQEANDLVARLQQELASLQTTSVGLGQKLALQQARARASEKQQQALKATVDSLERAVSAAEGDHQAGQAVVNDLQKTLGETRRQWLDALKDGGEANQNAEQLEAQVVSAQNAIKLYLTVGAVLVGALLVCLVWAFSKSARQRGEKWSSVAHDLESMEEGSAS